MKKDSSLEKAAIVSVNSIACDRRGVLKRASSDYKMDYWNRTELKCVSGFMSVREHIRNGKKSPVQNKMEDNVSLASLFHSKIRAGAINYGLQTVMLARCLSTLLRLSRESTVGLSGRSPFVDS